MDLMVVIAAGLMLLVILIVVTLTREQRKKDKHKSQIASNLGLSVLDEAPHELTRALNKLFQQPAHAPISYDYVFYKREFNADVYMFEIIETANREGSLSGQDTVAILSPLLSLPQFSLAALPDIDGNPARQSLMERMLYSLFNWAASRMDLTRLRFEDQHSTHQQIALFVDNEITAKHYFTPQRLQSLAGFPANFQVVGAGSTMIVSFLYHSPDSNPEDRFKKLHRLSNDLFHVLQLQG